jgi:hypothetical protein
MSNVRKRTGICEIREVTPTAVVAWCNGLSEGVRRGNGGSRLVLADRFKEYRAIA